MRWRGEPAAGDVGPWGVALAGMLLAALAAGESAGQPSGLFRAVAPAGVTVAGPPPSADSLTLRQRLVSIDFGQLAPPPDAAAATAMPAGALRLNLFDDASFTGLVERAAPTFSGGVLTVGPAGRR